jgi:hypothetical protein
MTDDVRERLARLEHDHDRTRDAWLFKAAEARGWHAPADAPLVVSKDDVVTAAAAAHAVEQFDKAHPYMRQEMITEEEQHRRWGQELLDALERS